MVKPVSDQSTRAPAYQQALDDFGITQLLSKLSCYSDADFDAARFKLQPPEIQYLAAILIYQLANQLNGKLLCRHLQALRQAQGDILPTPIALEFPAAIELPASFPEATPPKFLDGERLRYIPVENVSDFGIVIGRYYGYASHLQTWMWRYILWLDSSSPSAAWLNATAVWENDLEQFLASEVKRD